MRGLRLAAILVVSMVLLNLAAGIGAADPVELDPDEDLDGEGTVDDPYEISNASELQAMRGDLSASYVLTADIDASETKGWYSGAGFEPVGEDGPDIRFTGTFDGDNHTISDLHIDRGEDYVGLFGSVNDGKIEHVGLENADVTGNDQVGGLVGFNSGEIIDSSVNGTVKGTTDVGGLVGQSADDIIDSSFSGTVKGTDGVGGLVGAPNGDITNSYATGTVDGGEGVGGLVGGTSGDITDSYATSTVDGGQNVGGLVGGTYSSSHVTQSYATGEVNGSDYIGGLVGKVTDDSVVNESYAIGEITGTNNVGGLVGVTTDRGEVNNAYWDTESTNQLASDGGEGLTTAQMTGANASADGNMDGLDFENTWYLTVEYPSLGPPFEGEGTEAEPYEIEDVFDLQEMQKDLSANYTLTRDVDAIETKGWHDGKGFKPIEEFTGSLDGDGYAISSLYINRSTQTTALFEGVNGAVITNVAIENANITGGFSHTAGLAGYFNSGSTVSNVSVSGTFRGNSKVAGITGYSNGNRFENISGNVTVHAKGSEAGGLIASLEDSHLEDANAVVRITSTGDKVGGIVGTASGETITNVSATGTVVGNEQVGGIVGGLYESELHASSSTVDVNGEAQSGGLVGEISEGSVTSSSAHGPVNGTKNVGGLVGVNREGSIKNSSAHGSADGTENVGGLAGFTEGDLSGKDAVVVQSFATGIVDEEDSASYSGGLIGRDDVSDIEDSYWDIESTGQDDSAGDETGLTTEQMTGVDADTNMADLDFDGPWYVTPDYPEFTEYEHRGEGTEDAPYEISNVDELQLMENDLSANYTLTRDINASETEGWNNGAGFDPVGYTDFGSDNEFTGTFDGDDHRISDLYIDRDEDYVGLFGSTNDAEIQRVGLENVEISADDYVGGLAGSNNDGGVTETYVNGTINGRNTVGGLIGRNLRANVTDSYATGTVDGEYDVGGLVGRSGIDANIIDSHATVAVNGTIDAGGLVGHFYGSSNVIDSHATGDVNGTENVGGLLGKNKDNGVINSYSTGDVVGTKIVGGLVGINDDSDVIESHATGGVNGTNYIGGLVGDNRYGGKVADSYATGTVDGTDYVGGLVGNNDGSDVTTSYAIGEVDGTNYIGGLVADNSGTVEDAYWDINTTNQSTSAGGNAHGLTTDEMTGLNATENMEALDFTSTWTELDGYPVHQYAVSDLSVDLADDELDIGETTEATVEVTAYGQRGYWANTTADYDSSDSSVASVDRGTVTAERGGSTVIEAARAGVDDDVSLSVRRVSTGGGGGGGGGSSAAPAADNDDAETAEIETNDDGSVSATTSASADVPVSIELGDSVRDEESGTRFGRVDLTFGEDSEVSFRARLTNRDDLPDGTPALGGDGGSDPRDSDRAISYVEFTASSNGVDASDRVSSATIEFDVSVDTLDERGLESEDITLNRYDEDAGEWTELDTGIMKESDDEVTYESTTPGFSMFAVSERPTETDSANEPTDAEPVSESTETDSTNESTESTDTESATESTETGGDVPGFGLLAGVVALLALALLIRQRD